ncbi:MAG: transglycosylase SLT domain-containing protein [Flavobacterium sp.]
MSLIYQNSVPYSIRNSFLEKVVQICTRLEINPNWLMAIMYFESAKTFSPTIRNPHTGAIGLIQFMPNTAKNLGTSIEALSKMTALQQLDFVERYLRPYKGRINNYTDTYFAVFFPLAIGKSDDWVLSAKNLSESLIARQNPVFDVNRDQKIQVHEVRQVMLRKLPSEWLKNTAFTIVRNTALGIIPVLIIGALVTFLVLK